MAARPVPAPLGNGTGGHLDLPREDLSGADPLAPEREKGLYGPLRAAVLVPGPPVEVLDDRPPAATSRPQDPFASTATPGATASQLSGRADGSALELLERVDRDVAVLAELPDARLQLVVAGWLAGFRSARTRRAYGADLAAFAGWLPSILVFP